MWTRLRHILEMIRFSHTLFALPFAIVGAILGWRAEQAFRWLDLAGIVLCMVLARSTAMAFNRLADRKYDAVNPRTAGRHLPSGKLAVSAVLAFTIFCAVGFMAATLIFVASNDNWLPFSLAVPVLGFLCAYSLTKRFTALSHFWLGAALMLAPIAAWIAIRGRFQPWLDSPWAAYPHSGDWPPLILGFAVLCWVAGFDILYACQDVDFDRKAGLRSVPALIGLRASLAVAMVCHAAMVVMLVWLWHSAGLGMIYLIGVTAVGLLLAYEHWLVRPNDLSRVNQAFFHVNTVISVGLLLIVGLDLSIL